MYNDCRKNIPISRDINVNKINFENLYPNLNYVLQTNDSITLSEIEKFLDKNNCKNRSKCYTKYRI